MPITPLRILVVEDNQDAADAFGLLFESEGHRFKHAATAAATWPVMQEWQPQVLFLDIDLPDLDGFSLARQLGAAGLLKSTYVSALSGFGEPKDFVQAKQSGFHEYLVKPAEYPEFLRILDQAEQWLRDANAFKALRTG